MYGFIALIITFLSLAGFIINKVLKSRHTAEYKNNVDHARNQGKEISEEEEIEYMKRNKYPVPGILNYVLLGLMIISFGVGIFNNIFFYAQPGYVYHVRTIMGQENVVDSVGYNMHLFGHIDEWKKAMTVRTGKQGDDSEASISLPVQNIIFLDQVDANAGAMVRFRIPTDKVNFLKMAHEYRTPANLLSTALIPAFEETLDATGSLMSAEKYYSGGRTEFLTEFETQMKKGIYLVERHEITKNQAVVQKREADASKKDQAGYDDQQKTVFVVEKLYDENGLVRVKKQNFMDFGIRTVEARVTDMAPNQKFKVRMELKQQASADRAIAREQKIQEEEQKMLVIAKGEREIAEEQASMKKEQMKITTTAETEKKKVLIAANRQKEQAFIDKQTAQILLDKATIDAEAIKVAADAEAYKKEKILTADNALAQKLNTEFQIQQVWAEAYRYRNVPTYVIGSDGTTPTGSDGEASTFMKLLTIDTAERLNYNRNISTTTEPEFKGHK